jgi:hypothetical protein
VATIGGALQRNVVFDQVTFQLYANHYVILVGPPAVNKTTALNYGVDRLRKVDGLNVGPSSVTWQYLVDKLKDLQTASPEEIKTTRGGGMISRCIMPYANRPRRTITYPKHHVKANHAQQLSYLEHDLACIATLKGEYQMTKEAEEFGESWHKQVNSDNYDKKIQDDSDNWSNRRYSHVHKLAMVLAASKRDELTLRKKWCQYR